LNRGTRKVRTVNIRKLSLSPEENRVPDYGRPKTRGECKLFYDKFGWCPFAMCSHHLFLDINVSLDPETGEERGTITFNFPDQEVWEIPETCALEVADRGGCTLEEVGEFRNRTRERIRQIEEKGLRLVLFRVPPDST